MNSLFASVCALGLLLLGSSSASSDEEVLCTSDQKIVGVGFGYEGDANVIAINYLDDDGVRLAYEP